MFPVVCSHQFEDALVSQSVSQDRDAVLRAAAGCLPYSQGQGVRPGTKPQHAGAVSPHAPDTWNRAYHRTRRANRENEESEGGYN